MSGSRESPKTVLITGSTDGLGREVARRLAGDGATVLVHGRRRERADETVAEIHEATGNDRVDPYLADLASLAEVRRLAEEVEAAHDRLDVLINNAGIGPGTRDEGRVVSEDGYELRFAVNHLSHLLLTRLLLLLLQRSAPSRIVNVASGAQSPIDFNDVMLERSYDGWQAYSQSKLAQVMFSFELAERLRAEGETGVTVNALHPASLMPTKMVFEAFGTTADTIEQGAEATLRLAVSPDLGGVSGRYFEGLREGRAHRQAYDPGARRRLWYLSERLCGLGDGEVP